MLRKSVAAAVALVVMAWPAFAQDYTLGSLKIHDPWARATPKGAPVGGGYVSITNTGTTSDRLVGGTTDVSKGFEVQGNYAVARDLTLSVAYAHNKTRLPGEHQQQEGFPADTASIYATKTFWMNQDTSLRLGGGVRYVGRQLSGDPAVFQVITPHSTLVDAVAAIDHKNWSLQLNVVNLLGKYYYAQCLQYGSCTNGDPRTVNAAITMRRRRVDCRAAASPAVRKSAAAWGRSCVPLGASAARCCTAASRFPRYSSDGSRPARSHVVASSESCCRARNQSRSASSQSRSSGQACSSASWLIRTVSRSSVSRRALPNSRIATSAASASGRPSSRAERATGRAVSAESSPTRTRRSSIRRADSCAASSRAEYTWSAVVAMALVIPPAAR